MHPPAPSRSLGTFIAFASVAVIAALAGALFFSEARKHGEDADRLQAQVTAASEKLETMKYDAKGNVSPEKRGEYQMLMRDAQNTGPVQAMRDVQQKETMVSVAAFVAAGVLGFVAFRSLRAARRPATS